MTDLEIPAYHEAGHAVVAARLGVPFDSVTIAADVDSSGHLVLRDPYMYVHGEDVGPDGRDIRSGRLIIVWLAGRIAQRELCDRHEIPNLVAFAHGKWDIEQAYIVSADTSSGPEDTEQFLNEAEQLAYVAVEQDFLAIQEVAEGLIDRTTLTESEVKQIMHDTYAPFEEFIKQRQAQQPPRQSS